MTVATEVLLATAVLITSLSVLAMWRMRNPYQRMNYLAPAASLSAILITAAIFLQRGFKAESFKALFTTLVLIAMNSTVTHAAARAFRIAETKDWKPKPGEEVPVHSTDEPVKDKS